MSDEIPDRAAWLDHEPVYVDVPSLFEIERLGIEKTILTEGQVFLALDAPREEALISVNTVEIVGMDTEAGQASFAITGKRKLNQAWSLGGVNLSTREQWVQLE